MPRIELPAATAAKGPRLFELRTYESTSEKAHRAKVRMFAEIGEIDIFKRVGLTPVFFGRTLSGPRMPNLVYMLVHENMAGREQQLGCLQQRSGVEEAVVDGRLQRRGDRLEHHDRLPSTGRFLASMKKSEAF